jgi:hypothetical protein
VGTFNVVPPTYLFAGTNTAALLLANKSDVTLEGVGMATIQSLATHGSLICLYNVTNCNVRDITWVGPGLVQTNNTHWYAAITYLGSNRGGRVSGNHISNIQHGVAHLGRPNDTDGLVIQDNLFEDGGNELHTQLTFDGAAIAVGGRNQIIRGNTIRRWTRGIELEGGETTTPTSGNLVEGNHIMFCRREGICQLATSGNAVDYSGNTLADNVLSGCKLGIYVTGGQDLIISGGSVINSTNNAISVNVGHAPLNRITVSGVATYNSGSFGISVDGSAVRPATDVTITSCRVSSAVNYGVYLNATRGTVRDVDIYNVSAIGDGVRIGPQSVDVLVENIRAQSVVYGVQIGSGATSTVLGPCYVNTASSGTYLDGGTSTRVRAVGMNTDAWQFKGNDSFALNRAQTDAIMDVWAGPTVYGGAAVRLVGETRTSAAGMMQLYYGGGTAGSEAQGASTLRIYRLSSPNVSTLMSWMDWDGTFNVTNSIIAANLLARSDLTAINVNATNLTIETVNGGSLALTNALPVSEGGTGVRTLGSGQIVMGNGTAGLTTAVVGNNLTYANGRLDATGGGGGSVYVNAAEVLDPNLNSTTPNAPSEAKNVIWQSSATNVSAYLPYVTASVGGLVPPPPGPNLIFQSDGSSDPDWAANAASSPNYIPRPWDSSARTMKHTWWRIAPGGGSTTGLSTIGTYATVYGSGANFNPTATTPRGIAQVSTTALNANSGVYCPSTSGPMHADASWDINVLMQLSPGVSTNRVWVGVGSSNPKDTDTPDQFAGFRFSHAVGDTQWVTYNRNGSGGTFSTGVAFTNGVPYLLHVSKTAGQLIFEVNGTPVYTNTTGIPSGVVLGFYCVNTTLDTVASTIVLHDAYGEQHY